MYIEDGEDGPQSHLNHRGRISELTKLDKSLAFDMLSQRNF